MSEIPDIAINPYASPAEVRAVCEWMFRNITDAMDRRDLQVLSAKLREVLAEQHDFALGELPTEEEQRRIDDLFLGVVIGGTCALDDLDSHGCSDMDQMPHLMQHASQGIRWAGMALYLATEAEEFWPTEFADYSDPEVDGWE